MEFFRWNLLHKYYPHKDMAAREQRSAFIDVISLQQGKDCSNMKIDRKQPTTTGSFAPFTALSLGRRPDML